MKMEKNEWGLEFKPYREELKFAKKNRESGPTSGFGL